MFITFEGLDGSGKTTQLVNAAAWLQEIGVNVTTTREPSEVTGLNIRECLLNGSVDARTEALLYSADRAENVVRNLLPMMKSGKVVLQDRYLDSFYAYQVGGRGLDAEDVRQLAEFASYGLMPEMTLLFDLEPELARRRLGSMDKIEQCSLDFHNRVRESFLEIARQQPQRVRIVDAAQTPDEVWDRVRTLLLECLENAPPPVVDEDLEDLPELADLPPGFVVSTPPDLPEIVPVYGLFDESLYDSPDESPDEPLDKSPDGSSKRHG